MPVGHGGQMSKHPAWVKIIILEMLEERLKDAAAAAGIDNPDDVVWVYDPFTTEMDFYIWLKVSWEKYLEIYSLYYKPDLKARLEEMGLRQSMERVSDKYADHPYYGKAMDVLKELDSSQQIFNASRSRTTIFYDIEQMKNILLHGNPRDE
jgi:hypothetical protein